MRLAMWATVMFVLAGCGNSLRDDLTEAQADDVVALLQQGGVDTKKQRDENGMWSVVVDEKATRSAEQLIHLYGAPRKPHASIAEIFPGTGLLPSELQEHARYEFALGQELASTIEQIDGVLSARVHVAMPVRDPRVRDRQPPSASVFIRYRSDQRVDMMGAQIRRLVATALPGADAEAVSLMSVAVFPPAGGGHGPKDWLGVRYRPQDSARLALLVVLPWLLLALALAWVGWRAGMRRSARCWIATCRERLSGRLTPRSRRKR